MKDGARSRCLAIVAAERCTRRSRAAGARAPPHGRASRRIARRRGCRCGSRASPSSRRRFSRARRSRLSWAVENPTSVSIDPLGRVAPRGRRTLTPGVTTTYTLSVTGAGQQRRQAHGHRRRGGHDARRVAVRRVSGRRQEGRSREPRTASPIFPACTDTARAAADAARRPSRRRRAADDADAEAGRGEVQGRPRGRTTRACTRRACRRAFRRRSSCRTTSRSCRRRSTSSSRTSTSTCSASSRPTAGRIRPDPDPSWMGNPVARWEGDTLVVDSIGFNDKTEINGYRHTEALHVVERFSRPDFDTLQYEATIEDPNVFAGPWVIRRTFPFLPEYDPHQRVRLREQPRLQAAVREQVRLAYHGTPKRYFESLDPVQAVRAGAVRTRGLHPHDRGARGRVDHADEVLQVERRALGGAVHRSGSRDVPDPLR